MGATQLSLSSHAVACGVRGSAPRRYVPAELAAHTWDLARATGQIHALDPLVAVAALEGARAMIKPEYRNLVEPGSPYGSELPPPPGADDWDRLAAFMGHDPRAPLRQ